MARIRQAVGLIGWLALCYVAAGIGDYFTQMSVDTWYRTDLVKPWWTPPGIVFGVVWTILYTMMGIAAWLVWRRGGFTEHIRPLVFFVLQLTLNVKWSALFFGLRRPDLAAILVIILWVFILVTIIEFRKVSRAAAWLLAPYLGWTAFAAVLNVTVSVMNR